ncbi:CIC11C00000005451 [Sungouiella intermedia]|uniref:Protein YIF1 n=1 Tax=Sungouiella intermedia TaxID=45354 RepID=A0A1L0BN20_9ASCO|nr:CIC11C00000005451 [[Candida] intermedia]
MYNPYASAADAHSQQNNLQHPRPQHVAPVSSSNQYSRYNAQGQYQQQQYLNQYQPQQQYQQQQQQQQYNYEGGQYQENYQQPAQPQPQAQHRQYQQQHQQHEQHQQQHQLSQAGPYANFLSDPAASMAAQFAKSSFGQSNQYIQQNFGSYMPPAGELKYYFKVSNSYVWRKLALILFPYRHLNWARMTTAETAGSSGSGVSYAPPSEDVNAPDLYIPLMSFITYILLWALFLGLRGDFHPEVFGYLASQTLACLFLDILIFKVGLYLLNCSTQSLFWDLVSFSSYKYVAIIVLLCWKTAFGSLWLMFYTVFLLVVGSLSLFLMRSLKFLVLPIGATDSSAITISNNQRRLRVQFLFIYSVVVQFLIVLFMSR